MDAIVVAGGIPLPEDHLYPYTQGRSKALLDIAGKPMVQWVLDALSDAVKVNRVVIIGLTAKISLQCSKPTCYLQSEGHMLANIIAGVNKVIEINPQAEYALVVSADIPGITGEMVDWLVKQTEETRADVYYGVIPRKIMEKRYPDSRRTWTHLKDMDVCGADINVVHVSMATEHLDTWEALIGNRKSAFKQAAVIGYGTLLQLLFRRISIADALRRIHERIGIQAKDIIWPWAEAGMDVDKPNQLEIMREDLSGKK